MDSPAAPHPQIIAALARGATVITANQRAARTLRRDFDLHQRALGLASWQPPPILAWDSWTDSLWRTLLLQGHASDMLLSPTQEHILWRAIIAEDSASSLRPIDSLAELAADAFKLLHAYRGRQRLSAATASADTRAFARWAREFDRRCTRSHYLTQAQLPESLRVAIAEGKLSFASHAGLLLVGFDSRTPAQAALLEAIQSTGISIDELTLAPTTSSASLITAPDEYSELTACAHWLCSHLTKNPIDRIAVIVPAIEPTRAEIDRVFRNILAPELNDIAASTSSAPYEFSLGVLLAHTPMVATAFDMLHWISGSLPLDRICSLLLSPHFAASSHTSEHIARAEFDAFVLRQQHLLRPEISLNALHKLASDTKHSSGLPILLKHLEALRPLFNQKNLLTSERTYADWAAAIHELLEAAGWAPLSQLDSIEFQTRRKWESALDELATLDFDATRVTYEAALAALERIAAGTLFAPESRYAPIQIMGPLESAGSTFDAIWFLYASDLAWPSTPAPNPLLPWHLQRELAMPGTDPALDSALANHITQRISVSAPTALFSYAQESAESHQRASPALAELNLQPCSVFEIAPAALFTTPIALDAFTDDTPIPPPPDRVLQGGAGILASQAACSFRAFAEKRLFATALDPISLGLDPSERGSLVHTVLESFWAEVKDQATLKRMTSAARDAQLLRSIDFALNRHHARPDPGWPRAYISTERQRLLNLLHPWLDYEATQRAPFTVKSREAELPDVQIGPLHLDIRVDRVDLAYGEGNTDQPSAEIILDYKTGHAHPSDWLGERPDAPQLPLYAVVSKSPNLAAIAFASVRPGKDMGLSGYQVHDGILPKATKLKTDSLETQITEWREVLTTLAEDFHAGEARVSPKNYPQTCEYCQQRLLCRLDLSTLNADALEDSDASTTEADRG